MRIDPAAKEKLKIAIQRITEEMFELTGERMIAVVKAFPNVWKMLDEFFMLGSGMQALAFVAFFELVVALLPVPRKNRVMTERQAWWAIVESTRELIRFVLNIDDQGVLEWFVEVTALASWGIAKHFKLILKVFGVGDKADWVAFIKKKIRGRFLYAVFSVWAWAYSTVWAACWLIWCAAKWEDYFTKACLLQAASFTSAPHKRKRRRT